MKKTSPKKLHPMAHTDKQTDGHGDSMTDPAQRAESVKIFVLSSFRRLLLQKNNLSFSYVAYDKIILTKQSSVS